MEKADIKTLNKLGSDLADEMLMLKTLNNTIDLLSVSNVHPETAKDMLSPYYELLQRTIITLDDVASLLLNAEEVE